MSDVIRLLPDSVANKIAAGEVIQRPASALKELVENAVDAGAHDIKIVVRDGGKTLLQVVDDGKGMSETDARMAFERHATSKISEASDLFALHTMGFRGEALPSICAIAEVELRTRREEDAMGTRLVINSSKVECQESVSCPKGSNFMIKRIFANFPARRKFLRSDSVELNNIMREFERLALVNEKIRFSIDTGTRKIELMPGTFKQRISSIWKNNLKMELLPVDVDTDLVKISGFVSRPENARRHNPLQYLIVNGRNMRHPYFHKAILSCFERLIPSDSQPNYFLRFDVDPSTIDVNIHPTKNEIKFENEVTIRPLLVAAVRASLGKYATAPSIDFNSDAVQITPPRQGEFVGMPDQGIDSSYNPFDNPYTHGAGKNPFGGGGVASSSRIARPDDNWVKLYADFVTSGDRQTETNLMSRDDEGIDEMKNTLSPLCIQYADKYIVSSSRDGLLIIDQHRAHLKILFDRYMSNIRSEHLSVQHVMFPEIIELDSTRRSVFEGIEESLRKIGYILEYVDDNKWQIVGVPSFPGLKNHSEIIGTLLDSSDEESDGLGADNSSDDSVVRRIVLSMSRASAIRGGTKLSTMEMEQLVSELFMLPEPNYTPDGNVVYKLIDDSRIISMFTR